MTAQFYTQSTFWMVCSLLLSVVSFFCLGSFSIRASAVFCSHAMSVVCFCIQYQLVSSYMSFCRLSHVSLLCEVWAFASCWKLTFAFWGSIGVAWEVPRCTNINEHVWFGMFIIKSAPFGIMINALGWESGISMVKATPFWTMFWSVWLTVWNIHSWIPRAFSVCCELFFCHWALPRVFKLWTVLLHIHEQFQGPPCLSVWTCDILQCYAVLCSTLQCFVIFGSALHCFVMLCSDL